LNRLILILEAQDIPIWISKRESREFCREQDSDPSFALKTLLPSWFCWSLFLGYILNHIGMLGICQFFNQIRRPFFYQLDCCPILFFKTIFSHLESFMKVVVLHVYEFRFLSRLMAISETQDIHIWISNEKAKILPQEGFCPSSLQD